MQEAASCWRRRGRGCRGAMRAATPARLAETRNATPSRLSGSALHAAAPASWRRAERGQHATEQRNAERAAELALDDREGRRAARVGAGDRGELRRPGLAGRHTPSRRRRGTSARARSTGWYRARSARTTPPPARPRAGRTPSDDAARRAGRCARPAASKSRRPTLPETSSDPTTAATPPGRPADRAGPGTARRGTRTTRTATPD